MRDFATAFSSDAAFKIKYFVYERLLEKKNPENQNQKNQTKTKTKTRHIMFLYFFVEEEIISWRCKRNVLRETEGLLFYLSAAY